MANSDRTKRVLVVLGTRPEAIKMAPVIQALQACGARLSVKVCVTAQHRSMLDQVLTIFGIKPDYDLDLMRPNQDLFDVTSGVLTGMKGVIRDAKPDLLLVHGDTTTTMASSLAAYYEKVPVGHVEAGLRTGDIHAPFPEEVNRKLVAAIAELHFAPTTTARANLRAEGIADGRIFVTGNTVIDALFMALARLRENGRETAIIDQLLKATPALAGALGRAAERRFILVTGHRRENFGTGFEQICKALHTLAATNSDIDIVYPVHMNPHVREPVLRLLGGCSNIHLIDPLDYLPFVCLMQRCTLVLTDSGGIQEEAPSLGKPVLVLREVTERPEAVEAGTVLLVGADCARIVTGTERLLHDEAAYAAMAKAHNPYGDGQAATRIAAIIAGSGN